MAKKPLCYELRGWFFGFEVALFLNIVHNGSMENSIADIIPIIVAFITSGGGVLGAYLATQKGNRDRDIKDAQREQRQSDRLDSMDEKISRLEKKIDEHNGYGKKFGEVATSLVSMAKDIEYLKRK